MADANFDKAALAWTLPWDADWVSAVTFIGASRRVVAGNHLGQLLVWDLPEKPGDPLPAPVRRLDGHTNQISRLLCTPDGKWLISASYDHTIRYWDMEAEATEEGTVVLNPKAVADSIARRNNGAKKVDPVEVKVKVQKSARTLEGHKDWILGLAMTPDGATLVSGDDGGNVVLWDRAEGKEKSRFKVKGWVFALAISPDAKQLLVSERIPLVFDSGRYAAVKLWDAATGQVQHDLSKDYSKEGVIGSAAYSPDGKLLILARAGECDGPNGKVFTYDPATGKRLKELTPGHLNGSTDVVYHPDGKHVASSGRDTVIRLWDVAAGKQVKELGKPRGGQFKDWIHTVAFTRDGAWLAAADIDGAVHVWALNG